MNDDLQGRAKRAAVAVLTELGDPFSYDEIVTALAVAWADGYKAGTSDALTAVDVQVTA